PVGGAGGRFDGGRRRNGRSRASLAPTSPAVMEHHTLWIVEVVNRLLGPLVASLLSLPYHPGDQVIPDYLVMCALIVLGLTAFCVAVRSSFSVDNPGKVQIVL